MKELITQGGPLIFLLLGCSVLAVAIFLERYFYFHRSSIVVQDLLQGAGNLIARKNYVEALTVCAGTPGPVARVMKAVLTQHGATRADLKEIAQEAAARNPGHNTPHSIPTRPSQPPHSPAIRIPRAASQPAASTASVTRSTNPTGANASALITTNRASFRTASSFPCKSPSATSS